MEVDGGTNFWHLSGVPGLQGGMRAFHKLGKWWMESHSRLNHPHNCTDLEIHDFS